jgi:Reverse transcriptase (RNA-dependent DNA polymerase)
MFGYAEPDRTSGTRTVFVPTRREDGTLRWLARLDAREAAEYDAAVAGLTPVIERALGPEVVANRALGRGAHRTTALEPWRPARAQWRRTLSRAAAATPALEASMLVADVRQCYPSIRPEVLAARLRALGAGPAQIARVRAFIERSAAHGPGGLPVGPTPSAILANAVLGAVDERLRGAGVPHVRWVDDIVAFPRAGLQASRAFDALRRGLDEVGLEPNPSKTAILRGAGEVHERMVRFRPSTGGPSGVR